MLVFSVFLQQRKQTNIREKKERPMGRLHHPSNTICIFLSWSRSKGIAVERAETKLSGLRLLSMRIVEIGTASLRQLLSSVRECGAVSDGRESWSVQSQILPVRLETYWFLICFFNGLIRYAWEKLNQWHNGYCVIFHTWSQVPVT